MRASASEDSGRRTPAAVSPKRAPALKGRGFKPRHSQPIHRQALAPEGLGLPSRHICGDEFRVTWASSLWRTIRTRGERYGDITPVIKLPGAAWCLMSVWCDAGAYFCLPLIRASHCSWSGPRNRVIGNNMTTGNWRNRGPKKHSVLCSRRRLSRRCRWTIGPMPESGPSTHWIFRCRFCWAGTRIRHRSRRTPFWGHLFCVHASVYLW